MAMKENSFLGLGPAGFHRIAYVEWGDGGKPPLICVHGLTRNGRDFDHLAQALAGDYRVVCPDVVGRGKSEWLPDGSLYGQPQYMSDMAALIARVADGPVDWIGTSMGGLIGMMLAAQNGSPIRRLVVNDVGPFIPKTALERLASYVGGNPSFPNIQELEIYLRQVAAPFGPLSDGEWRHLALHSAKTLPDGTLGLAYDPAIGKAFRAQPLQDIDLWSVWDRIRCPVLVLRGAASDLLLAETADEMTRRGPHATVAEIAECGHAPALMDAAQIAAIRDWLAHAAV
jgi:pimeloyl-ACP methyl ester carboxylesterase